jgi:hypothetical protein
MINISDASCGGSATKGVDEEVRIPFGSFPTFTEAPDVLVRVFVGPEIASRTAQGQKRITIVRDFRLCTLKRRMQALIHFY